MDNDIAVKVESVSKKYCKSLRNSMYYGMSDIGRNLIGLSSRSEHLREDEFWAVDNVSFELKKGATLGLIGPNGSGKTTLMKMLNGIFWPDKGKITVRGKVGALIAVGAGFHPLLTGRENIYINGAILGMNRHEINRKFDDIVQFADIGDFLDSSVKHYSSGMYVRLGFAVAVHCEPDILLVDEVLSVGDINFQAKCINKMKELDSKGVSKIYVSHDLSSIQLICKKALYFSRGAIKYQGNVKEVINDFRKDVLSNGKNSDSSTRYGTNDLIINSVELLDDRGNCKGIFKRGEPFFIKINYNSKMIIKNPEFYIGFYSEDGNLISAPNTRDHGVPIQLDVGEGEIEYRMESLPLNVGKYILTIGCWDETGHIAYDHHEKFYDFIVEDGIIKDSVQERFGYLYMPSEWKVKIFR